MGGKIGGGAKIPFHHLAVEVGDHQLVGLHLLVGDTAGLDDDQSVLSVDAADVTEGVEDKAAAHQLEVGIQHHFAQTRQEHGEGWNPPVSIQSNRFLCLEKVEQHTASCQPGIGVEERNWSDGFGGVSRKRLPW